MKAISLAVVLGAGLLASRETRPHSPASPSRPCLGNQDTLDLWLPWMTARVANLSSTELAAVGLSVPPESVTVVADSATCSAVIVGINAFISAHDSAQMMTEAYVFAAASGYLAPRLPLLDSTPVLLFLLDSTKTVKAAWEMPH